MKRNSAVRSAWRMGALGLLVMAVTALSSPAYTLIVAPARYSVMQVSFDLLARTPSVLVSYQGEGAAAEPVLHAWNGSEWVLISLKDYREGNFLQRVPDRAVLIGDDATLPASVLEASGWVGDVVRVRDLTTGSLINEFGHILKWRDGDWQWFAKRYNLTLRDESESRRNSSWYDRPGPLPDRPRVMERIVEGPVAEPAPAVVVPAEVEPVQPVDAVPAVEPMPAAEPAMPEVSEPASSEPAAPAPAQPVDVVLDQQPKEALKVFEK